MKISPSLSCYSKFQNVNRIQAKLKEKRETKEQKIVSLASYRPFLGQINFGKNKSEDFKYRKISSATPDYRVFECKYNDLDEFCEKFARKMNSQLMPVSREDMIALINRIKMKTGAKDELIKEILFQLTTFSRYKSLDVLQQNFRKEKISYFGIELPEGDSMVADFSTNQSLNYLSRKVFYFLKRGEKRGIVLDDFVLTQLEELKKSNNIEKREQFEAIIQDINNGNVTFFNIKGWDVKCSDGKYRNSNMFSGSGFLESLAVDIIKRNQKGENTDDILYSDLEKRLKDIFKDEDIEKDLEIKRISDDKDYQKTPFDIMNNINKPSFSADEIKNIILAHSKLDSKEASKKLQKSLMKYLNEFSMVYSIDSLAFSLVKLKNKITSELKELGYGENDIQYVVTVPRKSFGLITNMYSKINGIDLDDIAFLQDKERILDKNNSKKARVILDDMSISGLSQTNACSKLNDLLCANDINSLVCYATVLNTDKAEESLDFYPQFKLISLQKTKLFGRAIDPQLNNSNGNFDEEIIEYCKKNFRDLNKSDCLRLLYNMDLGFLNSGLACEFPYMLPDNNSKIAGSIFSNHLYG